MRRLLSIAAAALALAAAPAHAQRGFALKGHFLYNHSNASGNGVTVRNEDGASVGAEYVLPLNIGVGVSAYGNRGSDGDASSRTYGAIAEANYFVRLPLRVSPYGGVHAGLGRSRYDAGGTSAILRDDRRHLGYQLGVRWQARGILGLDAQFRHVSDSASRTQSPDLERNQVLVGVTLF